MVVFFIFSLFYCAYNDEFSGFASGTAGWNLIILVPCQGLIQPSLFLGYPDKMVLLSRGYDYT